MKGEIGSFAIGHFAAGYVSSKLAAEITKTRLNIPLALTLSVIPDVDILIPFLEHRGPTHSIIVAAIIFIPLIIIWHGKAIPYFAALIQHPLISDFIAGGRTQILWPLTTQVYGIEISIKSSANITLEWILFLTSIFVMLKSRDMQTLLQPHNSNIILLAPLSTVILPALFAYPLDVPPVLIMPHIFFIALFSASLLIDLNKLLKTNNDKGRTLKGEI